MCNLAPCCPVRLYYLFYVLFLLCFEQNINDVDDDDDDDDIHIYFIKLMAANGCLNHTFRISASSLESNTSCCTRRPVL